MAKRKYDLAVVTGEYQNSQGETKKRYLNVGCIVQDNEGGFYMLLDRTFNPAGVPNPDNRSNVIVSMFEPKNKAQPQQQQQQKQQPDYDDDIPF